MRIFNRLRDVSQITLRLPAARLIPRFFLGTTDETTRVAELCPRKIFVTRAAVKMGVEIFEARPIREREAKASLVNELLTSMSKKSVAGFFTRFRPRNEQACAGRERHDRRLGVRVRQPRPLRRDAHGWRGFSRVEWRKRRVNREDGSLTRGGRRRFGRAQRHDGWPDRRSPGSARPGRFRSDRDHELCSKVCLRFLRAVSRCRGKSPAVW